MSPELVNDSNAGSASRQLCSPCSRPLPEARTPRATHRSTLRRSRDTVVREEDHVTALELAQWIKERRLGLRIVDVRSAEEYATYHVPRAEHFTLDSLATGPFRRDETIVLYSEGGAHAAQAWVFLRALGYPKVFFLRGGLYEWLDQVMNPTLADTHDGGACRVRAGQRS